MPYSWIFARPWMPSSFSASISAGRPWQSQPKRRSTRLPAHGLVARHDVLHVAGEQVPVVRQPVRERRAVVEHELSARLPAVLDRGAEEAVLLPVGERRAPRSRRASAGTGPRGKGRGAMEAGASVVSAGRRAAFRPPPMMQRSPRHRRLPWFPGLRPCLALAAPQQVKPAVVPAPKPEWPAVKPLQAQLAHRGRAGSSSDLAGQEHALFCREQGQGGGARLLVLPRPRVALLRTDPREMQAEYRGQAARLYLVDFERRTRSRAANDPLGAHARRPAEGRRHAAPILIDHGNLLADDFEAKTNSRGVPRRPRITILRYHGGIDDDRRASERKTGAVRCRERLRPRARHRAEAARSRSSTGRSPRARAQAGAQGRGWRGRRRRIEGAGR